MVPRYLGFIGYCSLLLATLFISTVVSGAILIAGVLMVSAAWILLGLEVGDVIMIANGMAMIGGPLIIAGILARNVTSYSQLPEVMVRFAPFVFLTGLVCWLLHLISHFRAWKELGISLFKYSAYCQIAAMVMMLAGMSTIPRTMPVNATNVTAIMNYIRGPTLEILVLAGLLGICSYILSAMSFISIKK